MMAASGGGRYLTRRRQARLQLPAGLGGGSALRRFTVYDRGFDPLDGASDEAPELDGGGRKQPARAAD